MASGVQYLSKINCESNIAGGNDPLLFQIDPEYRKLDKALIFESTVNSLFVNSNPDCQVTYSLVDA